MNLEWLAHFPEEIGFVSYIFGLFDGNNVFFIANFDIITPEMKFSEFNQIAQSMRCCYVL